MNNDQIFAKKLNKVKDFNFGAETASVFDDMLSRSVPFYHETQRMIGELGKDFVQPNTNVYDLGCSTGTTLLALHPEITPTAQLIGIDSSPEMLEKAKEKLDKALAGRPYKLVLADFNEKNLEIKDASLVIMNLTLQFVRPLHREHLIQIISSGMRKNGALILIEKVLCDGSDLNRFFIKQYYAFKKRNGYTDMEISQKREALENVLIPYRAKENESLLLRNGFRECEVFFKWYNFCGYLAVK